MTKRKGKCGLVYILESDCGQYHKYGVSTRMKKRLESINRSNPFGCKFHIVNASYSEDIYKSETQVRYTLENNGCYGEFIEFLRPEEGGAYLVGIVQRICEEYNYG